jgi:hypothetical protein
MGSHALVGDVSHAKGLPARKRGFIPSADGIIGKGVSHGLSLGPIEGFLELRVGCLENKPGLGARNTGKEKDECDERYPAHPMSPPGRKEVYIKYGFPMHFSFDYTEFGW